MEHRATQNRQAQECLAEQERVWKVQKNQEDAGELSRTLWVQVLEHAGALGPEPAVFPSV